MRAAGRMGGWGIATLALSLLACSRDWDAFDPRIAGATSSSTTGGGSGGTGGEAGAPATGGGGGGGGAGACGKTTAYAGDFETGLPTPWYGESSTDGYVSTNAGELVLGFNMATSNSYGQLISGRTADFSASEISVEATQVPGAAGSYAELELAAGSGSLRFQQTAGVLRFQRGAGGQWFALDEVTFDSDEHRFWRFRESAGTTYWEASSDASTWTELYDIDSAVLGALGQVRTVLRGVNSNPGIDGQVHFDNLNAGATPSPWCPIDGFTDAFDDGATDARWRVEAGSAQGSEDNGLSIQLSNDAYFNYISRSAYDLTAGTVTIELATAPVDGRAALRLLYNGSNYVELELEADELVAGVMNDGAGTVLENAPFSARDHRWWRFRVERDALNWETSADGQAWSSFAVQSSPDFLVEVEVRLESNGDTDGAQPELVKFANFNLPP